MQNDPPWVPWTAEDERKSILSMLLDMLESPDALDGLHTHDAVEHIVGLIRNGAHYPAPE